MRYNAVLSAETNQHFGKTRPLHLLCGRRGQARNHREAGTNLHLTLKMKAKYIFRDVGRLPVVSTAFFAKRWNSLHRPTWKPQIVYMYHYWLIFNFRRLFRLAASNSDFILKIWMFTNYSWNSVSLVLSAISLDVWLILGTVNRNTAPQISHNNGRN
jgi:hypothetical protein